MKRLLCLLPLLLASCETGKQPEAPKPAAVSIQAPAKPPIGRTIVLNETIVIENATFDGALPGGKVTKYVAGPKLGDGSQKEGQRPLFLLIGNATLKNVRMEGADGVHMRNAAGQRTFLLNVGNDDVGEDGWTVLAGSKGRFRIADSYFLHAKDKIGQINAPVEVVVENCYAEDFGKLARGCGTCGNQAFDITVKHAQARDGYAILMLTNDKARGKIVGGSYRNVQHIALAQSGAKIETVLTANPPRD